MISDRARTRLKGATRLLVRAAGGVEAAGVAAGVSHAQIGRYQSAHEPDTITIDKVLALETLDGVAPHVTEALADLIGCVLIRKPAVGAGGGAVEHLGAIAKETGDVLSATATALRDDGTISGGEVRALDLRTQVRDAIRALTEFEAALELIERPADRRAGAS